jgi:hypothetical protein
MASRRCITLKLTTRSLKIIIRNDIYRLRCNPLAYTSIGDSHCACTYYAGYSKVVHLGPITMHRIGRDCDIAGLIVKKILQLEYRTSVPKFIANHVWRMLPTKNVVLFFGEIDCRAHIGRQIKHDCPYTIVCQRLVTSYLHSVHIASLGHPNINFMTTTVVPPTSFLGDPEMPTVGSHDDRVEYTKCLNKCLKDVASENSIVLVDYAKNIPVDDNGCMLSDFHDGTVHLHPKYAGLIDSEVRSALCLSL